MKTVNKESIISLNNIEFNYEHNESLIKDLSLRVFTGEKVGILGANGAGKSTILKLITGLVVPTKGEVSVIGKPVNNKNLKSIRASIGYTFQDPDNQLFMPSVYDDIAFGLVHQHLDKEIIELRVDEVLDEVGGRKLKDKASYKMSGGEKRIITLATALVTKPEILILDEPSVGLDPKSRRQLIKLLQTRNETMIITTHDMDMALDLCDRVIVINEGEIVGDDKPVTIFNDRELICKNQLELPLRMQGCPICG